MGIGKWFKKKEDKNAQEIMGVPIKDLEAFRKLREKVYQELFGEPENVSHELERLVPHIDVYIFPPGHAGRSWYTLVSAGMSDFPMQLPEGVDRVYARREIILYCDQSNENLISMVRYFAHFPFAYATWLATGHTAHNPDPSRTIFANSLWAGVFFMDTVLLADYRLAEMLTFHGEAVQFLLAIPITQAELDYKLKNGFEALQDLFDEHHHPFVFDRHRASYV